MTRRDTPRIGAGNRPHIWCGGCHSSYPTDLDHCPVCHQPRWLTDVQMTVKRWQAREAYRRACEMGGEG